MIENHYKPEYPMGGTDPEPEAKPESTFDQKAFDEKWLREAITTLLRPSLLGFNSAAMLSDQIMMLVKSVYK